MGKDAKVVFAATVFNNSGESPLYFPEFNTPATNYGNAIRMDGEKGYHFFSNLVWGNWSITAAFADRKQIQPVSWGPTVFNDRGTSVNDVRNYVEAAYTREIHGGTLRWRTYYDAFHERNRFDYPSGFSGAPGIEDNRQNFLGDWAGTELTYRFDVDRRDRSITLFAQDERKLFERWKLDLGVRFDLSHYRSSFLSPRAALIYQPSPVWTYKLLYGRGFRNPSAFELFFDDGGRSGLPNPKARPEKADTVEFDVERKIGKRMNLLASAYGYRLRDFLVATYAGNGLIQYLNVGQIHAEGFELEINGRPTGWLEASASYAIQRSRDNDADSLENSP